MNVFMKISTEEKMPTSHNKISTKYFAISHMIHANENKWGKCT